MSVLLVADFERSEELPLPTPSGWLLARYDEAVRHGLRSRVMPHHLAATYWRDDASNVIRPMVEVLDDLRGCYEDRCLRDECGWA